MMSAGAAGSIAQVSVEATVAPVQAHHITLAGRIDVHSLYSFVRLMSDPRISEARQPILKLDSVGGSVTAAMAIGHLVRDRGFTTVVERGKECLSACVLILAAGTDRVIPSGKVGVHRPRHGVAMAAPSTVAQTRANDQLIEDMGRYLQAMGMGERLFITMVAVPPDRMRMLNRREMHAFGLLDAPAAADPRQVAAVLVPGDTGARAVGARKHVDTRSMRPRRQGAAAGHVKRSKRAVREVRRTTRSLAHPKTTRNETRVNVNAVANFERTAAES